MSDVGPGGGSREIAAFLALDGVLARMRERLGAQLAPAGAYAAADLAARATQRFAQLFIPSFCNAHAAAQGGLPEWLQLEGARLRPATGELRLDARQCLRLAVDFVARWGYSLVTVLASLRLGPPRRGATLVHGLGVADIFRGGDDREFLEYCRRGPIEPLARAGSMLIQLGIPGGRATDPAVRYVRSPLHALARSAGLAPGTALRACAALLCALARTAWRSLGSAEYLLLARDFADDALAAALDEAAAIEAVLLTTSNYSAQPLWMWARPRRFRVHLVWYSQNIRPLVRKGDPDFPVNPINRLIRADVMWVWMPSFGEYLAGLGIRAEMRSVGPVLWTLPPAAAPQMPARPVLAVFDVVPTTPEEDRRLGFVANYYTPANVRRFVEDIVRAASQAGARPLVQLKHKRDGRERRDPGYFRFVDELAAAGGDFELLPAQSSVYDMILRCTVAIALPCSSPAYVATALGKPAILYDPTSDLAPALDPAPGLQFVAGPAALQDALARLLDPPKAPA
jgi:hypothetical protein